MIIILLAVLIIPLKVEARSDTITVTLNKCVDGDTAWFNYKEDIIKVRFLAVNTMELKSNNKYADIAKEFTCDELTNAKKIKLEFDSKSDEKDKYDRYLTWVFVDDSLLQSKLIEKGYAEVKYIYGDYKYVDELKEKEKNAKENKLGIWSDDTEIETNEITKITNEDKIDYEYYIFVIILIVLCLVFKIPKSKIRKIIKAIK